MDKYIKAALEKHLSLLAPAIETAYEGIPFVPTTGIPYQKVQFAPQRPLNPTMGDSYYRDSGQLQIFLCYPIGKGTGEVLARAELLREHFKRGTTLTNGTRVVLITLTPQIAGTKMLGASVIIPVLITYSVEIN